MTLFSTHILLESILTYVCLSVSCKRYPFPDFSISKIGHPGKNTWLPFVQPNIRQPAWLTTWICWTRKTLPILWNFLFTPHILGGWFQSHLGNNLFVEYNYKFWTKIANLSLKQPVDDVHNYQQESPGTKSCPQVTWKSPWLPSSSVASLSSKVVERTWDWGGFHRSSGRVYRFQWIFFKDLLKGPRWWIPKSNLWGICFGRFVPGQNIGSDVYRFSLEIAGNLPYDAAIQDSLLREAVCESVSAPQNASTHHQLDSNLLEVNNLQQKHTASLHLISLDQLISCFRGAAGCESSSDPSFDIACQVGIEPRKKTSYFPH